MKKIGLAILFILIAWGIYAVFIQAKSYHVQIYNETGETLSGHLTVNEDPPRPFQQIKPADSQYIESVTLPRESNTLVVGIAKPLAVRGSCQVPGALKSRLGKACDPLYTRIAVFVGAGHVRCEWGCGWSD